MAQLSNIYITAIQFESKRQLGYLTIIPRVRVGCEMIDSQRGATRLVGYNHLISNKREWNNCFIKMPPKYRKLN